MTAGAARGVRRLALPLLLGLGLAATASSAVKPVVLPTPRVTTLGVTRDVRVHSFCWSTYGGKRRKCGKGAAGGRPSQSIPWQEGALVRIDLRRPAYALTLQMLRSIPCTPRSKLRRCKSNPDAAQGREQVKLEKQRVGTSGRRWEFRVPARSMRFTELWIDAWFAGRGSIFARLGLRGR